MVIRQTPDVSGIAAGLDILEQQLEKYGLKKKEIMKARLISEELMVSLIGHANADAAYMLTDADDGCVLPDDFPVGKT